jgi:hypothetical protein
MCNPYSRIAIYGATYGRAEYESLQCAQPNGSPSRQEHVERKSELKILITSEAERFNESPRKFKIDGKQEDEEEADNKQ